MKGWMNESNDTSRTKCCEIEIEISLILFHLRIFKPLVLLHFSRCSVTFTEGGNNLNQI